MLTSKPSRLNANAAARPAGPAPMTATRPAQRCITSRSRFGLAFLRPWASRRARRAKIGPKEKTKLCNLCTPNSLAKSLFWDRIWLARKGALRIRELTVPVATEAIAQNMLYFSESSLDFQYLCVCLPFRHVFVPMCVWPQVLRKTDEYVSKCKCNFSCHYPFSSKNMYLRQQILEEQTS